MKKANFIVFVLMISLIMARHAYAQLPKPNIPQITDTLKFIASFAYWFVIFTVLIIMVLKVAYGRLQASTGVPSIASRGYTETWEAVSGLVWTLIILLAAPWIAYIAASALGLPQVPETIVDVMTYIYTHNPLSP
jgi:hypothetical protein